MGYKVLYRKYRPDSFDSVVGQDYSVAMLKNAIITGKNSHAYIFTGPRGTGKTSSAKLFAKALNCENPIDGNPCNCCSSCLNFKESPDIIEIDAASNNGVDEIRELINNVKLVPTSCKYKVYIIDEVHMLTTSAFNALLLTLEEPPSHVVFILATTDIQDVPITILSRCQRFDFKPISKNAIVDRLRYVCDEESILCTDDALSEIAILSAGGMRDALGMLDQLSNDNSEISLELVSNYFGSVSPQKIDELLTGVEKNDIDCVVGILSDIRDSGTNYSVFIEKLIYELRKVAIGLKSGKSKHDFCFSDIYNFIFDLNECLCNININIDPYILIEIVILKYAGGTGNKKAVNVEVISPTKESNSNSGNNNDNKKSIVINKSTINFDVNVRINNCFVEASKEYKNGVSKSWVDFMNYLMNKDRKMISLLADTVILTASDRYILIQSSTASTNDLINSNIGDLEKYYRDYSGNNYYFCAVEQNLWVKEAEKYRINLKNKIKYSYMDEISLVDNTLKVEKEIVDESIEDVAKEIFGTYETE